VRNKISSLRLSDLYNKKSIVIKADERVSNNSRFGDELWDFNDHKIIRLNSVPASRLRIDWAKYSAERNQEKLRRGQQTIIPQTMIQELKTFAYLYLTVPSAFGKTNSHSIKPQTVVVMLRGMIFLFSRIYQRHQEVATSLNSKKSTIRSLTDISVRDLRKALIESDRADGAQLSGSLRALTSSLMSRALPSSRLKWTDKDVSTLEFKYPNKRTDYKRVMPKELFRLLSINACRDVTGFLLFNGIQPIDNSQKIPTHTFSGRISNGATAFNDYESIRIKDREYSSRRGSRGTLSQGERRHFKKSHGVTPQEYFKYISRVQRAAMTLIGLYTGARYSDLTSFTKDCVKSLHGTHVIVGTHAKQQKIKDKENADIWPAIPVMRDAFECLKLISRVTFNPYLLSAIETVPIGQTPKPMTLSSFAEAINKYLKVVDSTGRWSEWHINPHQLRHTLAQQLARADVGLVFIAQQMKHLHTALNSLPPDVTMMYGNISGLAQQRALHADQAYLEAAKELYSPDRPVAGGGAAEFIERRKSYFEGMAAEGWTTDELIIELAKQGLPFASVGIGYCGGKRETLLKDGTKELPPCLGSLQCNPAVCHQAVITKVHEPQWRRILQQNESLAADPRMSHAQEPLLAAADTARKVIQTLDPMRSKTENE
jgi:integrase